MVYCESRATISSLMPRKSERNCSWLHPCCKTINLRSTTVIITITTCQMIAIIRKTWIYTTGARICVTMVARFLKCTIQVKVWISTQLTIRVIFLKNNFLVKFIFMIFLIQWWSDYFIKCILEAPWRTHRLKNKFYSIIVACKNFEILV